MIVVKWATPEGVTITSPGHYPRLRDAFLYADALKGWPVAADAWVESDGVRVERPESLRSVRD
jgi:hypothetical protein